MSTEIAILQLEAKVPRSIDESCTSGPGLVKPAYPCTKNTSIRVRKPPSCRSIPWPTD